MPIMGWLRNQDNSIEFSQYHKWFLSHSKIYTLVNNDHPECLNVNFTGSKTGLEITKIIWSCTISCDYFCARKKSYGKWISLKLKYSFDETHPFFDLFSSHNRSKGFRLKFSRKINTYAKHFFHLKFNRTYSVWKSAWIFALFGNAWTLWIEWLILTSCTFIFLTSSGLIKYQLSCWTDPSEINRSGYKYSFT